MKTPNQSRGMDNEGLEPIPDLLALRYPLPLLIASSLFARNSFLSRIIKAVLFLEFQIDDVLNLFFAKFNESLLKIFPHNFCCY